MEPAAAVIGFMFFVCLTRQPEQPWLKESHVDEKRMQVPLGERAENMKLLFGRAICQ